MTSLPINIRRPQLALGNRSGTVPINASSAELQTLTATGNITLELTGSGMVGVVITQGSTSRTVTYGGTTLAVDSTAGASTLVEFWPVAGGGHRVVYPGAAASGGASRYAAVDNKTAAYTVVAADEGKLLTVTASGPLTVTLPGSFPTGASVDVMQAGAGSVTISGGTPPGGYSAVTRAQGSVVTCIRLASSWAIVGDLAASS